MLAKTATRQAGVVLAITLFAPLALAHDGPVDGHLVTGDPEGPWHRMLHDCASDYGHHAGAGLTQQGHGLTNLDIQETRRFGTPVIAFYLVLDKQHMAIRNLVDTRETVTFEAPEASVSTTFQKTGAQVFSYLSGDQPYFVDGPLEVVDLEDAFGPDLSRYALEFGYTYDQLDVEEDDKITDFEVVGSFRDHPNLPDWIPADRMLGGFWDPILGPLVGENPGCDPETDDEAFQAPYYKLKEDGPGD